MSNVARILARNLNEAQHEVLHRLSRDENVDLDNAELPNLIRYGFVETQVDGFSATIQLTPYGARIVTAVERVERYG